MLMIWIELLERQKLKRNTSLEKRHDPFSLQGERTNVLLMMIPFSGISHVDTNDMMARLCE